MAHDHDHHDHDHDHGHDHDHDHDEDVAQQLRLERAALRRRALAQIRQYPDVALRLKAHEVTEFDNDLAKLIARMTELMHDAEGVGLAATQVGVLRRLFVFEPEGIGPCAVVNPRLSKQSRDKEIDDEGCLSLQGVRVPVERATKVTLEGQNANGEAVSWEFEGLSARVVQHELDHLDGILIFDRADDEHRKQALGILRPQPVLG